MGFQEVRRQGSLWDPRLAPLLAMLAVALCGLPAAWSSHWMWLDDPIVVGSKLWPPDSEFNLSLHAQGRESIAHGLYFKLLSLVLPLQPSWYYLTNYAAHVCVIGLAALVVWQSTRAGVATALCIFTAGFASTGPEVFLTLLKQELPMTLWMLVALLLVVRLTRLDPSRLRGTLVALSTVTFLSGTLGKENFLILPFGLAVGVMCTSWRARRLRLAGRFSAALLFASIGTVAVFTERYLVGSCGILDGTYTGKLFEFHPTLAASIERAKIYMFQAGDAIVLVVVAGVACASCVVAATYRNRDLTVAHVVAVTCAAAAVTQVVFNVFFLKFVQVYYLYPAAVLATVALACLWPAASEQVGAASGPARWTQFCRIGLTTVLVGTAAITLPTFGLRVYAQSAIPASEWRLMSAMANLPPYSLVLLGFPPEAEMIENSALLLDRVLGRGDITIETALSPNNTARLSEAYAERRPVYLAFVYEPGENVKVGVRGVTQNSRSENLALASAYGIESICPGTRETVGPWPFTVSRVYPSLPPILTIRFGYGWEVDRVIPPSTSLSECQPIIYLGR
jgi:hypothetical protein